MAENENNTSNEVFDLYARIRNEAIELDKLPGAALAAVVGGSVVIGVVGGGLFWIPAAMSGAMFVYRAGVTALQYLSYSKGGQFSKINEGLKELEIIYSSPLPPEHKQRLADVVLMELGSTASVPAVRAALECKSNLVLNNHK